MADRNTVIRETVELGSVDGDLNVERGIINTIDARLRTTSTVET